MSDENSEDEDYFGVGVNGGIYFLDKKHYAQFPNRSLVEPLFPMFYRLHGHVVRMVVVSEEAINDLMENDDPLALEEFEMS